MQRIIEIDKINDQTFPPIHKERWTAIIPAAGRGSRLKTTLPKILYPILGKTILEWIVKLLDPVCSHFVFVLSPDTEESIRPHLELLLKNHFSIARQDSPTGMADAVALCRPFVKTVHCFILWGDQVTVRPETIDRCLRSHESRPNAALTLPTLTRKNPYVQVIRDEDDRIIHVIQGREQDEPSKEGENDCGFFLFDSKQLFKILDESRSSDTNIGAKTGERNFLPLLPRFENGLGSVVSLRLKDPSETVGINTPEEAKEVETILLKRAAR